MSRITKWKLEKTKVKVVFRLQFHATHIPQSGWDKLFITFVPTDSGKTTAKTTKANVRNGTCKWADPIYETTRLLQDTRSKQYDEKLYKLVVAMGSSRSSVLGEAIINLADYADASKPSAVALPLHGCNSGTVLHVTVQLLTSKTGFREFEQQRELREGGLQTGNDLHRGDESGSGKVSSSEEIAKDQVHERVRFKPESKELPSLEEEVGLTEEYADSAVGFDGSSNTSGSLYAEKHDTCSTHEIDSLKSTVAGDLSDLPYFQSPQTEKEDASDHRILAQGSIDSVHGWGSDYSMDNDLATSYEENSRLRASLEMAESSIFELKLEVMSLQSHADEIGVETQKLSHQLAAEITSGAELVKQVSVLKSECSKFKEDLEKLTNLNLSPQITSEKTSHPEHDLLFQDTQQTWLKDLFVVEDRLRKLQNKASLGFHEFDFTFLQSELEALLCVLQDLKHGTEHAIPLPDVPLKRMNLEAREMSLHKYEQIVPGMGSDLDLYQPESICPQLSIGSLVSQEYDPVGASDAMKGKIFELLRELDEAKVERESLTRKMEQMECYYEALIQELEENQKQLLGELQNLRNEHSTCLYTMATHKTEMESIRHDMNQQILRFAEERCDLDAHNKELERRAISSEAAVRRARLNYSIAVDQLQKDLELLSSQVVSMFETNENLMKQAFSDTSQPCFQGCLDAVQTPEYPDAIKLWSCQNQKAGLKKQFLGGDILSEDLKKSLSLQKELFQKVEEELGEMHSVNILLDVFSKTLQETLIEANASIGLMKDKMDELGQQLELSTESKNMLMVRLQASMDDVDTLNEYKASYIARCSDLVLQNQILEANLENVSKENCLLTHKITEWESLMVEYRSNESKYEACSAEKSELATLLRQETLKNANLQKEMSFLNQEARTFKAEFDELACSKDNLQKLVNFVQDRLGSMLAAFDTQYSGLSLSSNSVALDSKIEDFKGTILHLEEIQHNACRKILQLMEEKKDLESEKDIAQVSLSTARSENLVMTQKFKNDMQDMVTKLDMSNALVEKLQLELESVANKLYISSEVEEQYAHQNKELLANLALLEVELQQLTSKDGNLAQEILGLDALAEEIGRSQTTIAKLILEKQDLMISLQGKTEESVKLASELGSLNETLRYLQDELHVERGIRDKLESAVINLNSQLDEKHDKLLHFDQLKAELLHFRQLASDLELEKSRVCHLLLQHEECLDKLQEESSSLTSLESQLSEMHEYSIAADVRLTFVTTQHENLIEELLQHLQSSDGRLKVLQKQYLDVEGMFNRSVECEAHYIEEIANLTSTLESQRSELEASVAQTRVLSDSESIMTVQLEAYKMRFSTMEIRFSEDKTQHALEVEQLKHRLADAEEEIVNRMFSKEGLEITVIVLKSKLDEQHSRITSLHEHNDELMMLQTKCNELTRKLSEQVLKTEEFKNISIHLKELKDKAEAECLQAREKRESEGPSVAMQDSLRIAFIKEQYETKLQELRQQLSISKKHGEEMLWKLQDAIDEIENRKKSEASHLKRNEELSLKILELEGELQSVLCDKREKSKAYDRIKAELECAQLSLECCKEEKEKLEVSLQECNTEKSRIAVELTLVKGMMENCAVSIDIQKEGNGGLEKVEHMSKDLTPVDGTLSFGRIKEDVLVNGPTGNPFGKYLDQDSLMNSEAVEVRSSILVSEGVHSTEPMNVPPIVDVMSKSVHGIPERSLLDQGNLAHSSPTNVVVINDHFRAQSLRSSMEHLHEELERMKNENSFIPEDFHFDPDFQGLQSELLQLDKANEELGSIFPSFNQFSSSGNALERVLALEIELAEALRAKKKSSIHFQSSFLKQHSDEEAVLKSFRDINELIKDMLELKGRHAAVEVELKEMHDRYSQLSLQFAEVEGERQKLMMTLKNVRASRKLLQLNRSSSATLVDHPS
ncbi:unnamed protein product [Ilex paraguariensis]|uniref:C2 NT-type domain-containing protein n=1 Tax=Ilex paraguariensis TaxID=185542 RepID=A0ABC8TXQ3_9AQUA